MKNHLICTVTYYFYYRRYTMICVCVCVFLFVYSSVGIDSAIVVWFVSLVYYFFFVRLICSVEQRCIVSLTTCVLLESTRKLLHKSDSQKSRTNEYINNIIWIAICKTNLSSTSSSIWSCDMCTFNIHISVRQMVDIYTDEFIHAALNVIRLYARWWIQFLHVCEQ